MAYQVSLKELQERVLQAANLEGALQFITPAELTGYINGSIADWVDEVRGTTWNGTYNRSPHTLTTENGTQAYELPQDFLSLLSVDVYIAANTTPLPAYAYQEEQRDLFSNSPIGGGWGFSSPIHYQLQDSKISFIPVPLGAHSVRLNYVPTAPRLADPEDTLDSINGWEEYIVLDAAIKCLTKDGDAAMIPLLSARLERQRERIRAMAPRRDQQHAERVHVVENRGFSDWDW